MKRDMELVRTLLLRLESQHRGVGVIVFDYGDEELAVDGYEPATIMGHLGLIVDAGLAHGRLGGTGSFSFDGLTWSGHDFVDNVRDEEIWRRTKEGVSLAGGFTFDLMKGLAKGFVRKKIETLTGIDVSL